ncbi:thioredoxin TrxC [Zwartia panacis]|uniref:thioredoxin TrxC n=1 Tax=Zwartia panacis TaxID=2683345 RepID=UPI0025B2C4F9|nr:thioredoxin TrxC [Zwartia panacis]MDN4016100.1 thioredoxin TrxC [Zwartia panacis]
MRMTCPHCQKINQLPVDRLSSSPICGACKKDLLTAPVDVDELTFNELLASSPLPVVVDFWASWCGPCQMFAPTFKASAARHANRVLHVKINTEDNQMLSQRLNIRSIPTLAAYVGGKEVNRVSGALPAASLEQFVQRALAA